MSISMEWNPTAGHCLHFVTKAAILRLQEISIVPGKCGGRIIVDEYGPTPVQRLRVRWKLAAII